jgi:Zn-dependent M28 family amino/carboxypeptidase
MKRSVPGAALLALVVATLFVSPASGAIPVDSSELRAAVTVDGIMEHQIAFQQIADANGGTRASGLPGYDASADYVVERLEAAGYIVTRQEFVWDFFEELTTPILEQVSPTPTAYVWGEDFVTMDYSGSGDVTAVVQPTNDIVIPPGDTASTSNSGCEPEDFADFETGNIALVQRGTCDFIVKAMNAEAAGAVGVIIFNEGQEDLGRAELLAGTLGGPGVTVPVTGTTFALGEDLYEAWVAGTPVTVHMVTSTFTEPRTTENIFAETPAGRDDRVVLVGAHLDSVTEGPGINDNGSGSSTILEIAEEIAELGIEPTNTIRFAFWGAEESGLVGSEFYVSQLTKRERKNIAVNLNFDMVGSPNYVRFVYDGNGSDTETAGPVGSGQVEEVFLDYFASQGLETESTAFDGRSDYGPFIAVGIPAGGLFTGAEGIKTEEQAEIYGGTAGIAYDPCYHQACDTIDNLSESALDEMSDAAAHAVLTFAMTTSAVTGTARGGGGDVGELEFRGHMRRV